MPLFDYSCRKCGQNFEQLARSGEDEEAGICPECGASGAERQIVRFRVGGRGDLRETTEFHGCHPAIEPAGHACGSGCSHGKPSPTGGDS